MSVSRSASALGLSLATLLIAALAGASPPSASSTPPLAPWLRDSADSSKRQPYYLVLPGPAASEMLDRSQPLSSPANQLRMASQLKVLRAQHDQYLEPLRKLGVEVIGDYRRLANAFQVLATPAQRMTLERWGGIELIEPVPLLTPSTASAVPFVGANLLWNLNGTGYTGKGVRVGIIDTGIDYTHADFGGAGTSLAYNANEPAVVEPDTFPTAKVIGGRDFAGDAYTGTNSPHGDDDPLDCHATGGGDSAGGHGSHVAGIVAGTGVLSSGPGYGGPYNASLDPNAFRIGPGMAPEASLYALKIFGCTGSTSLLGSALDWASDPNNDGDMTDRLDVINMSVGGDYALSTKTEERMVTNLSNLGTVVVAAAGNDGNVFYVTGAPATYTASLAVAASTEGYSFGAMSVLSPASLAGDIPCAEGSFSRPLSSTGPITEQVVASAPTSGCDPFANAEAVRGHIAMVERGSCSFVTKFANALSAGAVAVLVSDRENAEIPATMGGDGSSSLPGVLIRKADGDRIREHLSEGVRITLDANKVYPQLLGGDEQAPFSSRGPNAQNNTLKPDISAPGLGIDSAGVGTGNDGRNMSGTSMACPMVAGAAALLKQIHPDWPAADLKALMMNQAGPVQNAYLNPAPVSLEGAGRIHLGPEALSEVTAAVTEPAGAVSLSFGSIVALEPYSDSRTVELTNRGTSPKTYQVAAAFSYPVSGVTLTPSVPTIEVPAGGKAQVQLTLQVNPSALPVDQRDAFTDEKQFDLVRQYLTEAAGHITFSGSSKDGAESLQVPFHAVVRAAADRKASPPAHCLLPSQSQTLSLSVTGASAHPHPFVTAFELAAESPAKNSTDPDVLATDLLAVGVATNAATAESFDKTQVYFGLAVAGDWTTPAKGELSVVGVGIDTNGDQRTDFLVLAEPMTRDKPFTDVLAVGVYDKSYNAVGHKHYLNIVPRDQRNTEPFNNGVVVLPVSLSDLGLTAQSPSFGFFAFTQSVTSVSYADRTSFVTYDISKRRIDTAKGGDKGLPFYGEGLPVQVSLSAEAGQTPPDVLLLHHTNIKGKRMEVVRMGEVSQVQPSDLRVTVDAPSQASSQSPLTVRLTVENQSDVPASDVTLTASFDGASRIVSGTWPQGTCTTTDKLSCALGTVAARGKVEVVATVQPGTSPIAIQAQAHTAFDCELTPDNNQAQDQVTLAADTDAGTSQDAGRQPLYDAAGYEAGGGCTCHAASGSSRSSAPWAALSAALLALSLRQAKRRAK